MALNTDTRTRFSHCVPDFPLVSLVCCKGKLMPLLCRFRLLPDREFPEAPFMPPYVQKCWHLYPLCVTDLEPPLLYPDCLCAKTGGYKQPLCQLGFNCSQECSCVFYTALSLEHKHTENNENQVVECTFASLFGRKPCTDVEPCNM